MARARVRRRCASVAGAKAGRTNVNAMTEASRRRAVWRAIIKPSPNVDEEFFPRESLIVPADACKAGPGESVLGQARLDGRGRGKLRPPVI